MLAIFGFTEHLFWSFCASFPCFLARQSCLNSALLHIRSSSQDDTDGTSSIVLPCPGSQIMFHLVPYVNIVLNILLCSPFSTCNNNIYCTIQAHLYFYITTSNVPFSDIFVPKHIFKACKNTIYCLIQSTLYFKKNIFYCPVITFIYLQYGV